MNQTAFDCIPIPERQAKPRSRGLNMVIDWGMGLARQADMLESRGMAGDASHPQGAYWLAGFTTGEA